VLRLEIVSVIVFENSGVHHFAKLLWPTDGSHRLVLTANDETLGVSAEL
jgi:hypothetical protein